MDLFTEFVNLQRLELVARMLTTERYTQRDKDIAIEWIANLASDLVDNVEKLQKTPHGGGVNSRGGGGTLQ